MKQSQSSNQEKKPTPIQSELPAIRTFYVYRREDVRLYGWEIEHKPYPASTQGYEFTNLVFGKRARFCFVSNDGSITRAECIHFGAALVNGTYAVFHVDLKGV